MVEANVKIIEELKLFLEAVGSDASLRKLFTQSNKTLAATESWACSGL